MTSAPPPLAAQSRAEHLASRFPPLMVAAERVATTVAQGVHGRRRVGQGETFWQFRRYEPGDETGLIDWRQTAKSRHVFVRETEWEAAQSAWLWRDTSPSMDYSSSREVESKRSRADLLLLGLAQEGLHARDELRGEQRQREQHQRHEQQAEPDAEEELRAHRGAAA